MAGVSWLKSRFLRWCRKPYNDARYGSSLRRSRFASVFFKDASFLDLSARSALRQKKFKMASSIYRKANDYGWVLRVITKTNSEQNSTLEIGSKLILYRLRIFPRAAL